MLPRMAMPSRKQLQDSALFWVALGAAVIVLGGVLMTRAPAKANLSDVWLTSGLAVALGGCFLLLWALVLFLAHRHAEKHMCPDPSVHGQAAPRATTPPFQVINVTDEKGAASLIRELGGHEIGPVAEPRLGKVGPERDPASQAETHDGDNEGDETGRGHA
jgi:hypothetical protein